MASARRIRISVLIALLGIFLGRIAFAFSFTELEESTWQSCAIEGGLCSFDGQRLIRYGTVGRWAYAVETGPSACTNQVFGDPAPGSPKHCDLGRATSHTLEGPRIAVLPVIYLFRDASEANVGSEEDRGILRCYLENAQRHFADLLGPQAQSFAFVEALVHRGRYSEDDIRRFSAGSADGPIDFEHAVVKEMFERRGSSRLSESHVFLFVFVRRNPLDLSPRRFAGGRSFNGGVNGGGGIVVMEYAEIRRGAYGTLVHELGHAFGLRHSDCLGDNMQQSDSIMSYNPRHRIRGFGPGPTPASLRPEERTSLLLSRRIFPNNLDPEELQQQSNTCLLPAMHRSIGEIPTVRGVGYDLRINERLVSGPEAIFLTRAQAWAHCDQTSTRYPSVKVECRFAGRRLRD